MCVAEVGAHRREVAHRGKMICGLAQRRLQSRAVLAPDKHLIYRYSVWAVPATGVMECQTKTEQAIRGRVLEQQFAASATKFEKCLRSTSQGSPNCPCASRFRGDAATCGMQTVRTITALPCFRAVLALLQRCRILMMLPKLCKCRLSLVAQGVRAGRRDGGRRRR